MSRAILAATLLLGLLASAFPLVTVASGPMCELACCAGRAPHAAGSCMNGSCQAFLNSTPETVYVNHEEQPEPAEQLCGLSQLSMTPTRIPLIETITVDDGSGIERDHSETSNHSSNQASIATTAFQQPCQPECGSCASGFARSNQQRNSAALAYADRPRPPSRGRPRNTDYGLTQTRSALGRRGAPRGPPGPVS
ncbi:MAG TPA: hypothetical protein VJS64_14840 [Pyrinomonadaceae bacterium]|nr:hypothetical protein [Pyrinomonadaceae bacterium]